MLFSDAQVATFIQQNFEPVWETVRPVPIVRIDFGEGHVLTRTLNGNIATYVCTAEGQVLDILPGIYTKPAYLAQLDQFRLLARYVELDGKDKRADRIRDYHRQQAEALAKKEVSRLVDVTPISKARIERPLKIVLWRGQATPPPVPVPLPAGGTPALDTPDDVASWKALAEDTQVNETLRRGQIHRMLADAGVVRPDAVKRRLYKEVLHADLDDPYLGLGPALFAHYPFRD